MRQLRRMAPASLLVVVVFLAFELRADLAGRPPGGVNVHIRRTGTNRSNKLAELAGGEPLRGRAVADIGGPDGAGDRSAVRGTRLRARPPRAEIPAQEDDPLAG